MNLAEELARGPKIRRTPTKADVIRLHQQGYSPRMIHYKTGFQMVTVRKWIGQHETGGEKGR